MDWRVLVPCLTEAPAPAGEAHCRSGLCAAFSVRAEGDMGHRRGDEFGASAAASESDGESGWVTASGTGVTESVT